ncbi:MAG: polyprenyl synthetase family protein [Actinomycetes bacterium]
MHVEDLHARVQKALDSFLARQEPLLHAISEDLDALNDALRDLLSGGKRLRPAFCYWAWRGASGAERDEAVAAAASLELLQACALVHDDVMDGSDTRRGQPSAHCRFATMHQESGWLGSPGRFGEGAAILLGDLLLAWTDQLYYASGLPAESLARGKPVLDLMRTEVMVGQYLDLVEQARGGGSSERAMRVLRFKSAKYSVEQPLHLGAALAGAPEPLRATYAAFGLPLGEAFQLRDDVLGVFGDPQVTGKPAGDDLREGKRTVLVGTAEERATPVQSAVLRDCLGDPDLGTDGVEALRDVIVTTGALSHVEGLIARLADQAEAALQAGDVAEPARGVLAALAVAATSRRD